MFLNDCLDLLFLGWGFVLLESVLLDRKYFCLKRWCAVLEIGHVASGWTQVLGLVSGTNFTGGVVIGFVDQISANFVRGWSSADVELLVDRRFVLDPAGYYERPDLAGAGVNARGFEFDLAASMPNYAPAELVVRPKARLHPLPGGYLQLSPLKPLQYVASNASARAHNERMMAGAVRGVCLFTSRTGSTMLTDFLRSHPRAYGFSEPIENFIRGGKAAFSYWLEDYFLLPSRIEYTHEVPDPVLMFMTTKIRHHDMDLFPMFNRYGVRYLRLYRENILKQAISQMVSVRLFKNSLNFNLERSAQPEFHSARKRIHVDPVALLSVIETYQELEKCVDHMVSTYAKGEVMSVSYEQLVSDESAAKRVFSYFGLEWMTPQSLHVKINSDDLAEVIENFDDVSAAIKRTRYSHLLFDD